MAFALCVLVALALAGEPSAAAKRDGASARQGLDRSLDDPQVRRRLDEWDRENRERDFSHPEFDELDGVERSLDGQRARRAERAERRRSPEERAERRRRRRAFKSLGRQEKVDLARSEFPQLFSEAGGQKALPLGAGEDVVRYAGDHTAIIESAGGERSLVDSSVPLRAPEGGALEPVSYDLVRTAEGWEPRNSPVEVRLGETADDAVSFPGGFGLSVPGVEAPGSLTGNEVFFADVARDTDLWFSPAPSGVRFAFQLRSEDAPEELRLELSSATGVELRVAAGAKAVEVFRDGRLAGRMRAPVALDADEREVDVTVRVEGDEIVFEIPHRGLDLEYPAVIDPAVENQDSWKYGLNNYAGWQYYEQVPQFPHGYSAGLYIHRNPNYYWYRGQFAEWQYHAPTAASAIYRTDFMHMAHASQATNTTQGLWSTRLSRHQHQYTQGYTYDAANSYWSACADGGTEAWQCDEAVDFYASNGNYAQTSLWASDYGPRPNYASMYMGGARVYLNDLNSPELFYFQDTGPGWTHDTPAGPYNAKNQAHVRWGDHGLGMWQLWMDVPGMARQHSTDAGGCTGARTSPCPQSRAHNFSYAGISEGTQTVTTTGQDVLNRTSQASKTLRIDRSPPAPPTGSGSLNARANDFVGPQAYTLGVQGSDSYSGVKDVSYRVVEDATGTQVASGSASNPSCGAYGCSTSWKPANDFYVDAGGWAAGRHTVELAVRDQLGDDPTHGPSSHTRRSSFTVEMDPSPPTVSVSHEGLEPWLDDDREVRTTVTGTDAASGIKSFGLEFPTGADETRTRGCSGTGAGRCPTQDSETFAYRTDPARFPQEGRHQLRAAVTDARGTGATSPAWQVNVDRTAPELALSGTLYDRRDQELSAGTYDLAVLATDGDASAAASERSGVRSLDVLLDGESVDFSDQECPAGSCSLAGSWRFDSAEHPGGEHVVEVVAEDHLGHQRKQTFRFRSGPCCIAPPGVWASALGMGPIVFGDVNGDARTDALGRDPLSRHVEVGLSNGSSFGAFESWGALAEFRTLTDLALGDANYDGLDDLIGRDPATGQVWVAASNGTSFEPGAVWGTWPSARSLKVVDVDGDGSVDLAGRDAVGGQIYVGYSDDTAFEPALSLTSYSVSATDGWDLADVNTDFAADLIIRSAGRVRVGLFDDSAFAPPTDWGSLPAGQQALFGDVDGDGAADMLGYDSQTQAATLSASTEASFDAPASFGGFPAGHRLSLIDGDGDGQADIAGEHLLLGDVRVALTDMALALNPPAGDSEPDPGLVYDDEDETLPATDPPVDLEDPPLQALAAGGPKREPLRLGFQDERRLNSRGQIPDPNAAPGQPQPYVREQDAYGSRANEVDGLDTPDKTDGLLTQYIYRHLKAAGGQRQATKPVMRFTVLWGQIENSLAAVARGEPRYYFEKLDRAVNQARDQGFHVYLTLTGTAKFESSSARPGTTRTGGPAPAGTPA